MAVSDWVPWLRGTFRSAFRIGKADVDASGVSAARTLTLPNASGTVTINAASLTADQLVLGNGSAGVKTPGGFSGASGDLQVTGWIKTLSAFQVTGGGGAVSILAGTGTLSLQLNGSGLTNLTLGSGTMSLSGSNTGDQTFASLSPLTTKGDVLGFSTVNGRLGVGTDGFVLTADAASTFGIKWAAGGSIPLTTKGDLLGFSTVNGRFVVGTDGFVLTADAASTFGIKWAAASGGGTTLKIAQVEDQKAQGTSGGTPSTGWNTRTQNTVKSDPNSILTSLGSNQIRPTAGTYMVFIFVPQYAADRGRARLKNVTDTTYHALSSGEYAYSVGAANANLLVGFDVITTDGSKFYTVEHYCQVATATYGLGVETNATGVSEVYARSIWIKIA